MSAGRLAIPFFHTTRDTTFMSARSVWLMPRTGSRIRSRLKHHRARVRGRVRARSRGHLGSVADGPRPRRFTSCPGSYARQPARLDQLDEQVPRVPGSPVSSRARYACPRDYVDAPSARISARAAATSGRSVSASPTMPIGFPSRATNARDAPPDARARARARSSGGTATPNPSRSPSVPQATRDPRAEIHANSSQSPGAS